jgi:hypothetical protein
VQVPISVKRSILMPAKGVVTDPRVNFLFGGIGDLILGIGIGIVVYKNKIFQAGGVCDGHASKRDDKCKKPADEGRHGAKNGLEGEMETQGE